MRCLFLTLIFSATVTCLTAQKLMDLESYTPGSEIPSITGHLNQYQKDYNKDLIISYTILSPDFIGMKQGTASLNAEGNFEIKMDANYPYQKIRIQVGNLYKGFLIVNKGLHFELDLNSISSKQDNYASKSVLFSGEDGALTQYYNLYHEYKQDKKAKYKGEIRSALRNRTSQAEFKVRQLKEGYENFEKLEKTFSKKNGKEYLWLLESERASDYYGDLISIFIGRPMPQPLWNEVLNYKPLIVSELSNRFYGILATKLWSHEEKEIRAFSRMIFKTKAATEEEKKQIDIFMTEQEKKNAGVSYDNEVYAKGVKDYLAKYDEQLANAKLDLFLQKAKELPRGKKGLVLIKGQPLDLVDREKYVAASIPAIEVEWQAQLMKAEFEQEKNLVESVTQILTTTPIDVPRPKLGQKVGDLRTGGELWKNEAVTTVELIRKIKTYYKEDNVIVYIWDFDCQACVTDIRRSALNFEDMEGRPIKILTLALGQDISELEWQSKLEEAAAQGEHLLLNNQMSANVRDYFQLSSAPAHLYFTSKGEYQPYRVLSIVSLDLYDLLGPGN